MLVMPDLWMGMDVTPDGDQPLAEGVGLPRNFGATRGIRLG
jgi:hypothetical protein